MSVKWMWGRRRTPEELIERREEMERRSRREYERAAGAKRKGRETR